MRAWPLHGGYRKSVTSTLIALSCVALSAFGGGGSSGDQDDQKIPLTVPKATCSPNDHLETALQGQVPAALRAAGFQGFNCNLQLVGQSRGDGANWQSAEFRDGDGGDKDRDRDGDGRICAYHGTAFTTANRTHLGVPVIDITNENNPMPTGYLTSISMLDPWESLKVNQQRKLLAAVNAHNGGGGPEIDIYDLSGDCRFPQLLASVAVGTGTDGSNVLAPVIGHEGNWAPDGLTYYIGNRAAQNNYAAVDTTDPTAPKLITTWETGFAGAPVVHGMSISDDGKRGYFVTMGG